MTAGDHEGEEREIYGVLKEIKELTYNSDENQKRTIVLFGCEWFRLEGRHKEKLEVYDTRFRSMNISSL